MVLVDAHAHILPRDPEVDRLARRDALPRVESTDRGGVILRGESVFREVRSSLWDLGDRVSELDAAGVEVQLVSPVPVVLELEAALATDYLRAVNVAVARDVAESDGRLRGLGGVSLNRPDAAVDLLVHAVEDLGLDGVEIGASGPGIELDDPRLRPFFEAADALDALVMVHPLGGGAGAVRRSGQPYDFGLGMLTDTAMAASALVFGGVLDACPRLRVLLSHGCGTFAWALPRLSMGTALGGDSSSGEHRALARRLWVDTLVFDPTLLGVVADRFGVDHLVLGTDHPFIGDELNLGAGRIRSAVAAGVLPDAALDGVLGANASALLGLGERVSGVRG